MQEASARMVDNNTTVERVVNMVRRELKSIANSGYCHVCVLMDKLSPHEPVNCIFQGTAACKRCSMKGHWTNQCPLGKFKINENECCTGCWLPMAVHGDNSFGDYCLWRNWKTALLHKYAQLHPKTDLETAAKHLFQEKNSLNIANCVIYLYNYFQNTKFQLK